MLRVRLRRFEDRNGAFQLFVFHFSREKRLEAHAIARIIFIGLGKGHSIRRQRQNGNSLIGTVREPNHSLDGHQRLRLRAADKHYPQIERRGHRLDEICRRLATQESCFGSRIGQRRVCGRGRADHCAAPDERAESNYPNRKTEPHNHPLNLSVGRSVAAMRNCEKARSRPDDRLPTRRRNSQLTGCFVRNEKCPD